MIEMQRDFTPFVDMLNGSSRILIAGCSGSGKSVALKGLIYTAMEKSPIYNMFAIIDLKRVELKVFRGSPHTISYITEPEDVKNMLDSILELIDYRYKEMEEKNQLMSDEPNVWVVVDEYADLMTIGSKEVEKSIQRIAQIGRAARVGLILCTQRPTKDVLNGKISCNLDVRLGLRTVNSQDSRNIIGISGCESLPEVGYGYLQIKGINRKVRIPMVEFEELDERVDYWREKLPKLAAKRRK